MSAALSCTGGGKSRPLGNKCILVKSRQRTPDPAKPRGDGIALLLRQLLLLVRGHLALQHGHGGIGFGQIVLDLLHGELMAQAPRQGQLVVGVGGTAVQLARGGLCRCS